MAFTTDDPVYASGADELTSESASAFLVRLGFTGTTLGHLQRIGATSYAVILDNLAGAVDPTTSDDSTSGYVVGSWWLNTVSGEFFRASDVTPSAAVWSNLSSGGGGGGTFISQSDTPSTYTGQGLELLRVNSAETAVEFFTEASIDHDGLTNFVANEHIDHTAVTLTAGTGLSGGGDISANRSFSVDEANVDHGGLGGLTDDDHTIYTLADGTRAFSGVVVGVTPTLGTHLATKDYVDSAILGLDWQDSVLDRDSGGPPGSPSADDRYIVDSATGAWSGATVDDIAEYNGTSWDFTTPNEGFATWVEDEDVLVVYNGTDWVQLSGTSDHGSLLGLGDDDHSQYALLAGRAGGQTLIGDTASGGDLTLQSTSNATRGKIILGTLSQFDEANGVLQLGTLDTPVAGDRVVAANSGTGQFDATNIAIEGYFSGADARPEITYLRSKSSTLNDTTSAAAETDDGDILGEFCYLGCRTDGGGGAAASAAAQLQVKQNGVTATTGVPADFDIILSDGVNRVSRLKINKDGNLLMEGTSAQGNAQEALHMATGTAPDGSPNNAIAILYTDDDPDNVAHFYGWDDLGSVCQLDFDAITVAASDETSDLSTGTAKFTFRFPYGFRLRSGDEGIRASVNTAPGASGLTVDVNKNGTTILSTKLTIDSTEETSLSAATPVVISDQDITDDDEMTIDIDAVDGTTPGKGLKVTFRGKYITT